MGSLRWCVALYYDAAAEMPPILNLNLAVSILPKIGSQVMRAHLAFAGSIIPTLDSRLVSPAFPEYNSTMAQEAEKCSSHSQNK